MDLRDRYGIDLSSSSQYLEMAMESVRLLPASAAIRSLLAWAMICCRYGVYGVEHVEEVLPRRPFVLRVLVGEVLGEVPILLEGGPQRLHRQLVVVRHRDLVHVRLLQQLLLPSEDIFQEVLVDACLIGEVVLD